MKKQIKCMCGSSLILDTTPYVKQRCSRCGYIHEYTEIVEVKISNETKGLNIGLYNKIRRNAK